MHRYRSREPIFIKETLSDPKSPARQGAGAPGTVHVHPNGRTLYLANRASERAIALSRRELLKGGALIGGFNICGPSDEPDAGLLGGARRRRKSPTWNNNFEQPSTKSTTWDRLWIRRSVVRVHPAVPQ